MKGLSVVVAMCMAWMMVLQDVAIVEAESKIPIAVIDLTPRGLSAAEVGVLSDRLRVELMLTEQFDVMTRERMNRILEEHQFQLTGVCDNEICLVEVGRLIGVRKMVAESVGRMGKLYSVSVWVVDVETGRMSQPLKEDYAGDIERLLTEVVPRLARRLAGLPPEPFLKRPFYKKWWFWTALGITAAGGAAAIISEKGDGGTETGIIEVDAAWPE